MSVDEIFNEHILPLCRSWLHEQDLTAEEFAKLDNYLKHISTLADGTNASIVHF